MRRGKRNEVSQAEVRRRSRSVDAGQAVVAGRFWTAGNNRLRYGGVQMGRRMRRSSRTLGTGNGSLVMRMLGHRDVEI